MRRWKWFLMVLMAVVLIGGTASAQWQWGVFAGTGDLLIFPYYDVSTDSQRQYFKIVNTSDFWIQGHIRFREYQCSIEVLDFDILLSPHDVWTFWVEPDVDGEGTPGIKSADSDTLENSANLGLSPFINGGVLIVPFSPVRLEDIGCVNHDDAVERIKKGYIEFVAEGAVLDSFMDPDGNDRANYNSLTDAAIADFKADGRLDSCFDAPNALYGNFYFVDTLTDRGYAGNAETYGNFRTAGDITIDANNHTCMSGVVTGVRHVDDCYVVYDPDHPSNPDADYGTPPYAQYENPANAADPLYNFDGDELVSGMNGLILHEPIGVRVKAYNPFYRPDWTTTYGPTLAFGNDYDDYPGIEGAANFNLATYLGSVDEVEQGGYWLFTYTIGDTTISGELTTTYVSEPDIAETYGQLTFFTKYYHYVYGYRLLFDPQNRSADANFTRWGYDRLGSRYNDGCATSCRQDIDFNFIAFDNEEHTFTPQGGISPIRGGEQKKLKYEANFEFIGPDADVFDTHDYTEGWMAADSFVVENDNISSFDYDNWYDAEWLRGYLPFAGYVVVGTTDGLEWFSRDWTVYWVRQ